MSDNDDLRQQLTALAQNPTGLTRQPLTILTGYAYSGGFRNYLSSLRTTGLIVGGNEQTLTITDAGFDALGPFDALPTGSALLDFWLNDKRLGRAERLVLKHLADIWPDSKSGPDVAEVTGYEYSGGFRNYLSKLRTLGLIEGSNASMQASGIFR